MPDIYSSSFEHGGITIIIARFMPFVRTFVPFVAGVAEMSRGKFTFYDITGGDLLPGVEMSLSAMTAHALLQQDGYTLNPF